ncbi:3281_t:CDS:10, partial [Acaulospora morrowiae]
KNMEESLSASDLLQYLNSWYSKTRVEYVDLAGDFGGGGLFVLEGDSLLYNFLFNPETHLLDFNAAFGGGQFLALTFLVETFIDKLKQRECKFHIVFFDTHKAIWNDPKFRVAREIVLSHLKSYQDVTGISIYEFDDWWGIDFATYIKERQPLFVLLGDGTTENPEIDSINIEKSNASIAWRGLIYHTLHNDLSVALIPGMEFRDSRAKAFVFNRDGNVNLETQAAKTGIISTCKNRLEEDKSQKQNVVDFTLSDDEKSLINSQNQTMWINGGKRVVLVILSLVGILRNKSSPEYWLLARLFLLHVYLLDDIALKSRTLPQLSEETENLATKFLDDFFDYCDYTLTSGIPNKALKNFEDLKNNLADLLDARLFASLVSFQRSGDLNYDKLPEAFKQGFDAAWHLLEGLSNEKLSEIVDNISKYSKKLPKLEPITYELYDVNLSLLPFNYDFFSNYLGDMDLEHASDDEIEVDTGVFGQSGSIPLEDITAWLPSESNEIQGRREYQKYVRFMERYAKSLNGTQGYYTQAISTEKKQAETKSVGKQKKSSTKLLEQIKEDKLKKTLEDSERFLDNAIEEISKFDVDSRLEQFKIKFVNEDKLKHPITRVRAQFYKLQILLESWSSYCRLRKISKKRIKDWYNTPVELYRQVFYIAFNYKEYLDRERYDVLLDVLQRLGMNDSRDRLIKMVENKELSTSTGNKEKQKKKGKGGSSKKKESTSSNSSPFPPLKFEMPRSSINLKLDDDLSDARFQMLHAGHLMDKNTNSVDDPRVPQFKPDKWQHEVLNIIDRNESALICCPTSSGKTFISFYAMEKVLREDDEGILIYVAPTKALVNQVSAEVYGRFKKNYGKGGKSSWGIFTREYRENHDICQILITVPEMLEILLLDPNSVKWVSKIRRIIFDEIHCIGEDRTGVIWEHLILLSQVPILALSATVGNPEEFTNWIKKAQKKRGYETRLIKTTKRYSDLMQFTYIPKYPLREFNTLNPKEYEDSLVPIHPFSALSPVLVAENGIPPDIKLVPGQCVELWDMMNRVSNEDPDIQHLDPDQYFEDIGYIVKDDADRYEDELKKLFVTWTRDSSKSASAREVISRLDNFKNHFEELENKAKVEDVDIYHDDFLKHSIVNLLAELSAQDKLPAIMFHMDRTGCNKLALHLEKLLREGEQLKRDNDEEYQTKKKNAMAQKEMQDKFKKRTRDVKKKSKADDDDDLEEVDEPPPPVFDWEAHDPDFTFVSPKYRMSIKEYEELKGSLRYKMTGDLAGLVDALDRGIGCHHAGLPKKYIQAVEILFRMRHLRVVFATGTLALGINMPARSVVFVGDSISLTALQFRQMAGRSGRRGFDPLGNVIFFGITQTKIKGLLTSGLARLSGNFPLTTTLVLRSLTLLKQSEDKESSEKAASGLFVDSFFCLGKESLARQARYHLRFSIEYLMREKLIDNSCNPINLSGMVAHLSPVEPSNFAMAALFKQGAFHELCSEIEDAEQLEQTLVLILAYIFNRIKLRSINKDWYKDILTEYPSKIYLPLLPEKVKNVLDQHNDRILKIYTEYVVSFAKKNDSKIGSDNILPLSKLQFLTQSRGTENTLISKLETQSVPFYARSPFISMCSSLGDQFYTIHDLINHIHSKIHLDLNSIPYIRTDERFLNSYILDFYIHGDEKVLTLANGIKPGDVWQLLRDFEIILDTIITSLRMRLMDDEKLVLDKFESVRKRFHEKFEKMWA